MNFWKDFMPGSLISSMALSLYFYIFYCGCQASSKGFMEENGHLYRIYRLSGIYGFYIDLCECQKISLERFDFYIGYGPSICQYIVGVKRHKSLHTQHIHYPSGLCY